MPKRPLTIGTQAFPSMTKATEYVKQILNHSDYAHEGAKLSGDDDSFMRELIFLHPDAENKIGVGVNHIEIRRNPDFPTTRCFFIVRPDGSSTEFSYGKCIAQKNTHLSNLKRAFRDAVAEDVSASRERLLRSEEVRALIAQQELIHMDHFDPTFDCLVGKFILQRPDVEWKQVEFEGLGVDNSSTVTFQDRELGAQFRAFHSAHAKLRPVTRLENLSDHKTGVRKFEIGEDLFVYAHPEDWAREFPLEEAGEVPQSD